MSAQTTPAFPVVPRDVLIRIPRLRLSRSELDDLAAQRTARVENYLARVEIIALEIGSRRIASESFDLRATLARRTIFE